MLTGPAVLLYVLLWLVIVPGGLYLIIRTAVEHGIRRAGRGTDPRLLAALAERDRERTRDQ